MTKQLTGVHAHKLSQHGKDKGLRFWAEAQNTRKDGEIDRRSRPRQAFGWDFYLKPDGTLRIYFYGILAFESHDHKGVWFRNKEQSQ